MSSTSNDNRNNFYIITPLLRQCNLFATIPPCKYGEIAPCTKIYKVYAVIVMAVSVSGYIFSTYGKHTDIKPFIHPTMLIVDTLYNTFLTSLSIVTTLLTIFIYRSDLKLLLEKTIEVDNCINLVAHRRKKFWIYFIGYHVLYLVMFIYDITNSSLKLGWWFLKYYVSGDIQYYQITLILFFIFYIILEISLRFEAINKILIDRVSNYKIKYFVEESNLKCVGSKELKSISVWYNDICELVNIFNKIFGIIMLIGVVFIIILLLNYIGIYIVYAFGKIRVGNIRFGVDLLVLSVGWSLVALFQTLSLAYAGNRLAKEASNTAVLCYILLNKIPTSLHMEAEKELKEELMLIAQQAICRSPTISAAGFFTVNYSMFGFIVASFSSYLIIMIQFIG